MAVIVESAFLTVQIQVVRFSHLLQRIMTYHILRQCLSACLCAVCCIGLAACAGAPVQEMSNARQAINAARAAGAARTAPESLTQAQSLLQAAEASLHKGFYREARRNAVSARSKASEALLASQAMADRTG